jgi:hypothetical protein
MCGAYSLKALAGVQENGTFKECIRLVKLLWNREFEPAWPILRSCEWPYGVVPMAQQLEVVLRARVESFISRAYVKISLANASALLGVDPVRLVAGLSSPQL